MDGPISVTERLLPCVAPWKAVEVAVVPLERQRGTATSLTIKQFGFCVGGGLRKKQMIKITKVHRSSVVYFDQKNELIIENRTLFHRLLNSNGTDTLEKNDILLSINGANVSGMTIPQVVSIMDKMFHNWKPVRLCLVRVRPEDSWAFSLLSYLSDFQRRDAFAFGLQHTIYQNALVTHAPLTTRPQQDGEKQGTPYHFISGKLFRLLRDENSLLLDGEYEGYSYGISCIDFEGDDRTEIVSMATDTRTVSQVKQLLEKPSLVRRHSFLEALGLAGDETRCQDGSTLTNLQQLPLSRTAVKRRVPESTDVSPI